MKLDHVVYFTEKAPEEMVAEQQAVDSHAVVGGSHEKWGTHNALLYMKNAYIEWLSVEKYGHCRKGRSSVEKLLLMTLKMVKVGEHLFVCRRD